MVRPHGALARPVAPKTMTRNCKLAWLGLIHILGGIARGGVGVPCETRRHIFAPAYDLGPARARHGAFERREPWLRRDGSRRKPASRRWDLLVARHRRLI